MPHPTPQGETISAHETMSTDKTERAAFDAYPPLPEMIDLGDSGASNYGYSEACMRAYVDADRKARAALPSQPATVVPVARVAFTEAVAYLHYAGKKPSLRRVDFNPQPSAIERASGWKTIELTERAPAPSAPAESGWQPIASAPKDGTRIILAWPGGIWTGHYEARTSNTHLTPWRRDKWGLGDTAHGAAPTHWHPLPAAPSAAQPGGADGGTS